MKQYVCVEGGGVLSLHSGFKQFLFISYAPIKISKRQITHRLSLMQCVQCEVFEMPLILIIFDSVQAHDLNLKHLQVC